MSLMLSRTQQRVGLTASPQALCLRCPLSLSSSVCTTSGRCWPSAAPQRLPLGRQSQCGVKTHASLHVAITGPLHDVVLERASLLSAHQELYAVSEGLETPVQLIYLVVLLGFLGVGAYLVVRQVLIRRELDEAAKALGERIRTNQASCEDFFELGVILTRKRLFTQATKNLEKAKKQWDGEESELAQVHNALGFCYFSMDKSDLALEEYKRAVELQPGYVTAWNNLGDANEKLKDWRGALNAYQEALSFAPDNKVAMQRADYCRSRLENRGML